VSKSDEQPVSNPRCMHQSSRSPARTWTRAWWAGDVVGILPTQSGESGTSRSIAIVVEIVAEGIKKMVTV